MHSLDNMWPLPMFRPNHCDAALASIRPLAGPLICETRCNLNLSNWNNQWKISTTLWSYLYDAHLCEPVVIRTDLYG